MLTGCQPVSQCCTHEEIVQIHKSGVKGWPVYACVWLHPESILGHIIITLPMATRADVYLEDSTVKGIYEMLPAVSELCDFVITVKC